LQKCHHTTVSCAGGPTPDFIEVPGRAHPGTGIREGPPPLNKKGVPSLPFID